MGGPDATTRKIMCVTVHTTQWNKRESMICYCIWSTRPWNQPNYGHSSALVCQVVVISHIYKLVWYYVAYNFKVAQYTQPFTYQYSNIPLNAVVKKVQRRLHIQQCPQCSSHSIEWMYVWSDCHVQSDDVAGKETCSWYKSEQISNWIVLKWSLRTHCRLLSNLLQQH